MKREDCAWRGGYILCFLKALMFEWAWHAVRELGTCWASPSLQMGVATWCTTRLPPLGWWCMRPGHTHGSVPLSFFRCMRSWSERRVLAPTTRWVRNPAHPYVYADGAPRGPQLLFLQLTWWAARNKTKPRRWGVRGGCFCLSWERLFTL